MGVYITPMAKNKDSIAYVRFEDEQLERLRQVADSQERSIAAVIRVAVSQYLRRVAS